MDTIHILIAPSCGMVVGVAHVPTCMATPRTATLHTTCHAHLPYTACHTRLLDPCLLVLGEGVRGEGAQLTDLLHALLLFLEETAFGGIVLHGLAFFGYL